MRILHDDPSTLAADIMGHTDMLPLTRIGDHEDVHAPVSCSGMQPENFTSRQRRASMPTPLPPPSKAWEPVAHGCERVPRCRVQPEALGVLK